MIKVIGFDWDRGNRTKCQKHGVSIVEIEYALNSTPTIAPDLAHSQKELRYVAIGLTSQKRYVFISFTFRDVNGLRLIRPVSARYMHKKEISGYEKKNSHHDDRQGS